MVIPSTFCLKKSILDYTTILLYQRGERIGRELLYYIIFNDVILCCCWCSSCSSSSVYYSKIHDLQIFIKIINIFSKCQTICNISSQCCTAQTIYTSVIIICLIRQNNTTIDIHIITSDIFEIDFCVYGSLSPVRPAVTVFPFGCGMNLLL